MNWIKKSFISLSLILFSCLIGVLLIEGVLQLMKNKDGWDVTREGNILRNVQFQYKINNTNDSDFTRLNYIRNEYGLRDDCSKIEDIDILTIGGSTTDQRYVKYEDTFQKILQDILIAENPDFGCVSNAGVDGHSTWGHIFSFENWFPLIPKLKPKYILLYIGLNDVDFKKAAVPNIGFDTKLDYGTKAFLKKFELVQRLLPIYRYIMQSYQNKSKAYATHDKKKVAKDNYTITTLNEKTINLSSINAKAFKSRLELIMNYIKDLGAVPICVTQPHRFVINKNGILYGLPNVLGDEFSGLDYDYSLREINSVIKELCDKNTLDLYNYAFLDEHFYDRTHTTAKGSIVVGNLIAKFIIENL